MDGEGVQVFFFFVLGQPVHKVLQARHAVVNLRAVSVAALGHDGDGRVHGLHGLVELDIAPGVIAGIDRTAAFPMAADLVPDFPVFDTVFLGDVGVFHPGRRHLGGAASEIDDDERDALGLHRVDEIHVLLETEDFPVPQLGGGIGAGGDGASLGPVHLGAAVEGFKFGDRVGAPVPLGAFG